MQGGGRSCGPAGAVRSWANIQLGVVRVHPAGELPVDEALLPMLGRAAQNKGLAATDAESMGQRDIPW